MHLLLLILGWTLLIGGGAVFVIQRLARTADKPRSAPPDPRPPAVNLVWPDDVDHLLDDVAGDLVDDVDRTEPHLLACGYCAFVSSASTTLEAIALDQVHWRTHHAFQLALESAS